LRSLQLRRPVFEPWTTTIPGESVTQRPRARNSAIMERNATSLMILTLVPDPEWAPPFPDAQGTEPRLEGLNSLDGGRVWDTIIQIVDVQNGTALATGRSPHTLMAVEGTTDELYHTMIREDGSVTIRIWKVDLRAAMSDTQDKG
jgi:hypothetical protein